MKTSKFFTPALILCVILSIFAVAFAFDFIIGDNYRHYTPGEPDTASTLPAPPVPSVSSVSPAASLSNILINSNDSISNIDKYWQLKTSEIMETAVECTPSLDYICPYADSKCVSTIEFTDVDKHLTTWDIHIFNLDNVIGTWIVSETGILWKYISLHLGQCERAHWKLSFGW